mgnify:CR=1 FL=1
MGKNRNRALCSPWSDIARYIEEVGMSDECLNGVATQYGRAIDVNNVNIRKEELIRRGWGRIKISFACKNLPEVSQKIQIIRIRYLEKVG